jgi:hypothetical protein
MLLADLALGELGWVLGAECEIPRKVKVDSAGKQGKSGMPGYLADLHVREGKLFRMALLCEVALQLEARESWDWLGFGRAVHGPAELSTSGTSD